MKSSHRWSFSPELKGTLRLALLYLCVGAAWIVLSDRALAAIVRDPAMYAQFQTIKGWFYVAATSLLFGFFSFGELRRISELQNREIRSRKEFEETITAALREKEALLRELHHRVKNNLQLISSLLSLRMDRIVDPDSLVFFREFLSRVRVMAVVYDSLYAKEKFAGVSLDVLLRELASEYASAFGSLGIRFSYDSEERIDVDMEKAVPLALIVNEAVLNAVGHAFPLGKGGQVTIGANPEGDSIVLAVRDDGVGFDAEEVDRESVGLTIIHLLAQQIGAKVDIASSASGTELSLRVPAIKRD